MTSELRDEDLEKVAGGKITLSYTLTWKCEVCGTCQDVKSTGKVEKGTTGSKRCSCCNKLTKHEVVAINGK